MLFFLITATPAGAYYAHLLDTSASAPGAHGPACSVFDPNDASTHTWSGNDDNIANLGSFDGIVAYGYSPGAPGYRVGVAAYDPGDRQWHTQNYGYYNSAVAGLLNAGGTVAYGYYMGASGYRVGVAAYDPGDRQWHTQNYGYYNNAVAGLLNAGGIVAYGYYMGASGYRVGVAAYDPGDRQWHTQNYGYYNNAVAGLLNAGGIVAYSYYMGASGYRVGVAAYDPGDRQWHTQNYGYYNNAVSSLKNSGGIVAYSYYMGASGYRVGVVVYDPGDGQWHEQNYGYYGTQPSNLNVSNGYVSWTVGSTPYSYFLARVPRSFFTADIMSGNAPLYVQFSDNSVGGISSYWWNFGDGAGSSERSPSHTFTGFGIYTVTFQVTGPGGSHFTNMTITTDTNAPTGSILINGGAQLTTTNAVSLSLVAIDNSGSVQNMRFSNNGVDWTAWESYAFTKAWSLTSGYGTNTVSVQFNDLAGNISSTYSATIRLIENKAPTFSGPMTIASGKLAFSICGVAGQQYVLQSSSNLTVWAPIITNTLATDCTTLTNNVPATSKSQFYRIMLLP